MKSYQLEILEKFSVVDDYEEGEIGEEFNYFISETITGGSIQELIAKGIEFVGGAPDCYSTDIEPEFGRIDFQTMETPLGVEPSGAELKLWQEGKLKLWACYYIGIISELNAVDLTKIKVAQS